MNEIHEDLVAIIRVLNKAMKSMSCRYQDAADVQRLKEVEQDG